MAYLHQIKYLWGVAVVALWGCEDAEARRRAAAEEAAASAVAQISAGRWDVLWGQLAPTYQATYKTPDALRAQLELVEGEVKSAGLQAVVDEVAPAGESWRGRARLVDEVDERREIVVELMLTSSPPRVARIEATVAKRDLEREPPVLAVQATLKVLRERGGEALYDELGAAHRAQYTREAHAALMAEQSGLLRGRAAIRQVGYDAPRAAVVVAHHSAADGAQGIVIYQVTRAYGAPWRVETLGALLEAPAVAEPHDKPSIAQ